MNFEIFRRDHYIGDLKQEENKTWSFHPADDGDLKVRRYVFFQDAITGEQVDSYREVSSKITRDVERSNAYNGSKHVGIIHGIVGCYWLERFGKRPIFRTYMDKSRLLRDENVKEERLT